MPLLQNLGWGVRWGLKFAVVYSAFALIALLFGGAAVFQHSGTTFVFAIGLYFAAGLVAGAIVGVLRPVTRGPIGAAIVGVIAAIPICVLTRFSIDRSPWTIADTIAWSALAVLWGAPCGYFAKRIASRRR
ncbi:MAG TPA: hypothetical protein VFW98_17645 [Gemmatimonadaceae bacterium]|nr:hypothetical protein [Gemmatimonadaceae bacterium]